MRVTFQGLLAFSVAGCGGMPDKNQDPTKNNAATYRRDWKECREDYLEVSSGAHVQQWIGCMGLKGWK